MTVTVPREMPAAIAALQEFEVQRIDALAPEAGGYLGGIQQGYPLWLATWSIARIGAAKSDELRAWLASMRGSQRRFFGRDVSRPYPKAYLAGFSGMTRAGGGSFDGSTTSWSVAITTVDDCEVTLNGLPAAFAFTFGDYIGFKWDDAAGTAGNRYRRELVRAVAPAVANGSGVAVVKVEPPVSTVVPVGAIAHLDNPACVMAIVSDQTRLEAIDRRLAVRGGTIVALQDRRA